MALGPERRRTPEEKRTSGKINDNRIKRVGFADIKLLNSFNKLKSGKFEDKQLASEIDGAINKLKEDPFCGVAVAKLLWPITYIREYKIRNLKKYDLRNGWRLIYTI